MNQISGINPARQQLVLRPIQAQTVVQQLLGQHRLDARAIDTLVEKQAADRFDRPDGKIPARPCPAPDRLAQSGRDSMAH